MQKTIEATIAAEMAKKSVKKEAKVDPEERKRQMEFRMAADLAERKKIND